MTDATVVKISINSELLLVSETKKTKKQMIHVEENTYLGTKKKKHKTIK